MSELFSRTRLLVGSAALNRLASARVAVVGLGGVGAAAAEALARGGVGSLVLVDHEQYAESDLNRQLFALHSTIGTAKVEAAAARLKDINPWLHISALRLRYCPENADLLFSADESGRELSYIIDAIDSLKDKVDLACRAKARGIPMVSVMGAGRKLDPSAFELADIFATSVCPLAREMRAALRARGIDSLNVVYSRETPLPASAPAVPIGSVSFVPPVAGYIAASAALRAIMAASA